jgi:hypothetical protein
VLPKPALPKPGPVPELFSEEWFRALAAALDGLAPGPPATDEPGAGIALGQIVTGVPPKTGAGPQQTEVRYTIVLRPEGSASLVRDSTESASVVLVEDFSTAAAIASGASVPDLLNAGRIKLRGDSRVLVSAGDLLARVGPLIAAALTAAKSC